MEEIQNIKLAMSKIVPMFALKWDEVKNATSYKITFSNGRKSEMVTKPLFRIPEDVNITNVVPFIQAFKGDKKLTKKVPVHYKTTNIILLG